MKKRPVGRPRKKKKSNDPALRLPEWCLPWEEDYKAWEKQEKWLPPERHWPPHLRRRVFNRVNLRIDDTTKDMLNQLVDEGYRLTPKTLLMAFRKGACWLDEYLRKIGKREEYYRSVMW